MCHRMCNRWTLRRPRPIVARGLPVLRGTRFDRGHRFEERPPHDVARLLQRRREVGVPVLRDASVVPIVVDVQLFPLLKL